MLFLPRFRLTIACLLAMLAFAAPVLARADTYHMLVGSETRSFDHPPLVMHSSKGWITGQAVGLIERDRRFTPEELLSGGTVSYVSLTAAEREGYRLSYNPLNNLLQLAGRVERLDYDPGRGDLRVGALTPITLTGRQKPDDRTLIELTVEGGWIGEIPARDYPGDPLAKRISFKGQPELGRSFIFVRQPQRIGFAISEDTLAATASRQPGQMYLVRFGNFVELTALRKSASGEMAITLELGSKVEPRAQLLSGPTRLVVDFPGAKLDGGPRNYRPQGTASSVRLEAGPTGARLVVGMPSRLDWRILSSNGGARQQLQLLPFASAGGNPRAGRAILIDAGHGGSDSGAVAVDPGGTYEKELTSAISARLKGELQRLGYTVLETRPGDKFVSLGQRGDYANLLLPWLFVSVHCNSFKPELEGVITFIHNDAGAESRRAAQLVQQEFVAATGAVDKGVREEDFFVLRETVMPSILVECGFMSHTEECGRLCDPAYQQKIAEGIARGIDRYVLGK